MGPWLTSAAVTGNFTEIQCIEPRAMASLKRLFGRHTTSSARLNNSKCHVGKSNGNSY